MSKQKEDVLLMIKHVRYKKVDGTLYVNSGRVAWRNQTSDTFRISAAFEDIRIQRVSPEQKEKVQLQLLMNNSESFTFHFADPSGRDKQMEMRNKVKDSLTQLLPTFKDKAHDALKEKYRVLESNPHLLSLYRELVVTGILSSEEFWARPEFSLLAADTIVNSSAHQKAPSGQQQQSRTSKLPPTSASSQSEASLRGGHTERLLLPGVPNYLLSNIKPQADGTGGVRYNLSRETTEAIFRAYPTVRSRHRELVPDKLSEAEFWIKFFQSHYFHRDRVLIKNDTIFRECAAQDDQIMLAEVRKCKRLRLSGYLGLSELEDHDMGDGFGTEAEAATSQAEVDEAAASSAEKCNSNQLLLRRFNQNSMMILKSLSVGEPLPVVAPAEVPNRKEPSYREVVAQGKLKNRLFRFDLLKETEDEPVELELCDPRVYETALAHCHNSSSEAARGSSSPTRTNHRLHQNQAKQALQACRASINVARRIRRTGANIFSDYDAQLAISDVSAGGCLMGAKPGTRSESSNTVLGIHPPDRASNPASALPEGRTAGSEANHAVVLLSTEKSKELNLLYASAGELLRHFWACFPVSNPRLAGKLERMNASIVAFREKKLFHFIDSIEATNPLPEGSMPSAKTPAQGPRMRYRSKITAHLESMLEKAESKHKEWNERTRHQAQIRLASNDPSDAKCT